MIAQWWEVYASIAGASVQIQSGRGRVGPVPAGAWVSLVDARNETKVWAGVRRIVRVTRRKAGGQRLRAPLDVWWEVDRRVAHSLSDARKLSSQARDRGRPGRVVRVSRYAAPKPAAPVLRTSDGLVYVWR